MKRSRSKFHAKAVRYDGIYFPSTGEFHRYQDLKLAEAAGEIKKLEVHPRYPIVYNGDQVCVVELDFYYERGGVPIFEDFKGVYTSESRLRHKLFEAFWGHKVLITRAPTYRKKPRRRR